MPATNQIQAPPKPTGSSSHIKKTFCRVCEPACGLLATVKDGAVTELRPDPHHPVTKGYACHKGLYFKDIHNDKDRLSTPLKKQPDGSFAPVSWAEAIGDIAKRLNAILAKHGGDGVASYRGNPMSFNALFWPAYNSFTKQLGITRKFSSATQDCTNKFAGGGLVFGTQLFHPIPDLENTDFVMIVGENPAISHMSFLSIGDPIRELKKIEERGGKVVFVNPRRIESARHVGEVQMIKPDTDVYLFAAMLHEIHATKGFENADTLEHAKNLDKLTDFIRGYSPEKVSKITGIAAEQIRALAHEFSESPTASIHMSTGVNMGRQGTTAYWLLQMLSFVTGNLGHKGGNILAPSMHTPNPEVARSAGSPEPENRRRLIDGPFGPMHDPARSLVDLPGNLIADYILEGETPSRAMFVFGGNPVLSIGGEKRMSEALDSLELLVHVDIYRNASAEYADYVLPATSAFERPDINRTGQGFQPKASLQYTPALVEPGFERKPEWWILDELLVAMGLQSVRDPEHGQSLEDEMWAYLRRTIEKKGLSTDDLQNTGAAFYDSFLPEDLYSLVSGVNCYADEIHSAVERMDVIFEELHAEPAETLKLITKRDNNMVNSWFSNLPKLKRKERAKNYLYMHEADASARKLRDGDTVVVQNEHGKVTIELKYTDELMPGVVAMTHGWGHQSAPGLSFAHSTPGVNANVLTPAGPGSFEPLSNQAHMTGIPVEVALQDA